MHKNLYKIWIDGTCNEDLGIIPQAYPTFSGAEPKVTTYAIPGRNGDLTYWDGTYSNVQVKIPCYVIDAINAEPAISAVNALVADGGYHKFVISTEPGRYRMARFLSAPDINIRAMHLAPFSLNLDCKPQRWFDSAEKIDIAGTGGTIFNPTAFVAKPVMRCTFASGNGGVTMTITNGRGASTVYFGVLGSDADWIDVDFESKTAALSTGEEYHIQTFDADGLAPGLNTITITSVLTNRFSAISVDPRWWTL